MCRRTGALGILIALAATVPSAPAAHAQDLNCRDFTYQEEAQALFNLDRSDPNGLDEEQGPDDDIACEALPHRGDPATSSTSSPRPVPTTATPTTLVTPTAPAVAPPVLTAPAPVTPTRGVEGGLGGSSETGPSDWDIGIGLAAAAGAAAAAGYAVRRRRR
ncbi:excalibur calcium-binding protein [Streptomyces sp. NPDC055186]